MSECKASRRLVKSPPELWSEVSSAASLNRHMDQFGEIRITRLEPETAVAWEGEHARGTVRLEPSGWGTRVSLTAEPIGALTGRGVAAPGADVVAPAADPVGTLGLPYAAVEAEIRELTAFLERSRREAEKRRWTRRVGEALRRWFRQPIKMDPAASAATGLADTEPEVGADVAGAPGRNEGPLGPVVSPSAALNAVLDSLGQAHHRPFSRP
jgi:hypothetical protein